MLPVGRRAWSLNISPNMGTGLGSKAADEEARAEVEVLNSRLDKTSQLSKKIQASLARLESNAKSMQAAIGPLVGDTNKLQVLRNNVDGILNAIDKIRQPSDIKSNEEDIIRRGPQQAGLQLFLGSVKRVNKALLDMKRTNLRSNQQSAADLNRLLKSGNSQLENYFANILQEDSRPVEPLMFLTKEKDFPELNRGRIELLKQINSYIASTTRQSGYVGDSPVFQVYANVRNPYLLTTLQNLASASINTARKKTPDAMYRQGTNGIGTYAQGLQGAFLAEYNNICELFSRDDRAKVFNLTCQGAISEFGRTLRELNTHIKANLNTDCYLAYEIVEIMSNISSTLEEKTGELKPSFAVALKPIKDTAKSSLADLLEDTRRRIQSIQMIPADGAALPVTVETMTRLQTMIDFLRPVSSIMISIGDGGWKASASTNNSSDQIPTLNSFDVTADGKQIFANYCNDTINTLLTSLDQKAKPLMKSKQTLGVFILNNATVIDRMIRGSDLQPLLSSRVTDIDKWSKMGVTLYTGPWKEPSTVLFDVQYTSKIQRPPSGSAAAIDSTLILKSLTSKDKDAIKEKFRLFNVGFDELVAKHKSLSMEKEVRQMLSRQVQQMIEPLYCRFWDRYHEIDKGKGKYVKYNKAEISGVFLSLG